MGEYKDKASESRSRGGRAPRFDVKHFTKSEVEKAFTENRTFTSACIDLGLLPKNSKSPFRAIRNMHKLLNHFNIPSHKLGGKQRGKKIITCPHCEEIFTY
jgi:hypothetical protein